MAEQTEVRARRPVGGSHIGRSPATLGRSCTETERRKAAIPFRYYLFTNMQHWTITYSMIAKGRESQRCQFSRDRER
jgi:hypothetical protein